MKKGIKVIQLAEENNLKILAGKKGLKLITEQMISRPELKFGFMDFFEPKRVILMVPRAP